MGVFNLSFFKEYEFIGAITHGYCDLKENNCTANNTPDTVRQFNLFERNGNRRPICVCNNCEEILSNQVKKKP